MPPSESALGPVAAVIAALIKGSPKNVTEIAREIGSRPNVLSMIQHGKTRIPIARVAALADALNMHRWDLMYRCLTEYDPKLYTALEECFPGINLSLADVDWLPEARRFFFEMKKSRSHWRKRARSQRLEFSTGVAA